MPYEETLAAFRRGDNDEARRLARLDLGESTEDGDPSGQVNALCMLARVALRDGQFDDVDSFASQALDVALAVPNTALRRMPIHLQAVAAFSHGGVVPDPDDAFEMADLRQKLEGM